MQPQSSSTSQQIAALLPKLPEADRVRLLQFAQAMIDQRKGKRQQRNARLAKPLIDSWKI